MKIKLSFNLLNKKKQKGTDLVPKGILRTIVPKDFMEKFPKNEVAKISKHLIYI